jgi:hypothetical protein
MAEYATVSITLERRASELFSAQKRIHKLTLLMSDLYGKICHKRTFVTDTPK